MMGRLTVCLPGTLHEQLTLLADREGVSLNQYIVYALTRQVTLAYTVQAVPEQEAA
jgi:predicted HicB family RNase H-like nuclease